MELLRGSGEVHETGGNPPSAPVPACRGPPDKAIAVHPSWPQPGGTALCARASLAVQWHAEKRPTISW
ncbi:Hypothetical protein SMAX5B_007564, partial [Scophthalmus maximus]